MDDNAPPMPPQMPDPGYQPHQPMPSGQPSQPDQTPSPVPQPMPQQPPQTAPAPQAQAASQRPPLRIDHNLLAELGLGSLPEEEKKSLEKHIYETLEMRVGMRLADQMTNEQLDEFETYFNARDDAGAFRWLETNFPNYKDIVAEEFEKLKAEVGAQAQAILAASQQSAATPQAAPPPTPPMPPASPAQPEPPLPPSLQTPPPGTDRPPEPPMPGQYGAPPNQQP